MINNYTMHPLHPVGFTQFGTSYLYGVDHNQYFQQKPSCRYLFATKEEAEQYKTWIATELKPRVVKVRVTVEEIKDND